MANRTIVVTDSAIGYDDLADKHDNVARDVTDSAVGVDTVSLTSKTSYQTFAETAVATEAVNLTVYTGGIWQYAYYVPFVVQGLRDPANNANYLRPSAWLKNSQDQDWEED